MERIEFFVVRDWEYICNEFVIHTKTGETSGGMLLVHDMPLEVGTPLHLIAEVMAPPGVPYTIGVETRGEQNMTIAGETRTGTGWAEQANFNVKTTAPTAIFGISLHTTQGGPDLTIRRAMLGINESLRPWPEFPGNVIMRTLCQAQRVTQVTRNPFQVVPHLVKQLPTPPFPFSVR